MECQFFLGACSCEGFVSHYDSLLQDVTDLTILKGGSGCGKSTFMKALGRAASEKGLGVHYILCSSDPDSLDGVLFPELSVGFVDGTAPHVLEPIVCGGSANYLNFGEFYHRQAMKQNEEHILNLQKKNKAQYDLVHSCLRAINGLWDCVRCETEAPVYSEETQAIGECLCLSALRPKFGMGTKSRRFLTVLTPKGPRFCHHTPAALCPKVYVLRDDYLLAPRVLSLVEAKAISYGYHCISCYSPWMPRCAPSHLMIPELGVSFVRDSKEFPYEGTRYCSIDLNSTLSPGSRKELSFVHKTIGELIRVITRHLSAAKELHDQMESLCRPFIDFDKITALTDKTIDALFL